MVLEDTILFPEGGGQVGTKLKASYQGHTEYWLKIVSICWFSVAFNAIQRAIWFTAECIVPRNSTSLNPISAL